MRWILRIALTLLTLVVVAVAALFLIPTDRIARLAEAKFEETTGRQLTLAGEVSPQLFPRLGIALEGVSIANADWAGDEPMVEATSLEVAVGLGALLGGDIVVEAFSIEQPTIRLQRNAQGVANWDFVTATDSDTGEDGATPDFSLPKATITGGTLTYDDTQTGLSQRLTDLDATVALADLAGTGQIDLSARLQGQPISVSGTLNGVQQLLDGGIQGVDVTMTSGANVVSFAGNVGLEPLQAKGTLDADLGNLGGLMSMAGQTLPVIPQGLGQHPKVKGEVTLTADNQLFLRNSVIDLDQNQLRGDIDVTLSEPPLVKAKLTGGALDFSAMSTDTTAGDGAANTGSGGWSDARLDVSGLGAVNGEFTFKAEAVDLGSIQLGKTDMIGRLDRSRMVLDLARVGVFEGAVTGQFVVNGRGGVSVGGDLDASGVAMQKVLSDFTGFERLSGDAEIALKFLGVGSTMNEIMNNLSGSGRMNIGAGELRGLDIAGMIRNLDASYEGDGSKTIFQSIGASFTMENGILRNSDLSFVADLLTATGTGELDLGAQTVNYRVVPEALGDQTDGGITVPVVITGPWGNMKFRPDLKGLIDANLEAEKAKLEAAAKAKEDELKARAAEKIRDELGVQRQEGDSIKDTLKQGLEDKAKDRLRGFLGGN